MKRMGLAPPLPADRVDGDIELPGFTALPPHIVIDPKPLPDFGSVGSDACDKLAANLLAAEKHEHDGGGAFGEKQSAGNPKDVAAMTGGRLDISLFPQTAIIYGTLAMTEGDAKYGGYNYRRVGVRVSTYVAAILRHLFKFFNGEWADPKTTVPHLASCIGCLAVLIDAWEMRRVIDDRPIFSPVVALLDRCQNIVKHLYKIFPGGPGRVTEIEHGKSENTPGA